MSASGAVRSLPRSGKPRRFITREERRARKQGSAVPYLRVDDRLCRAFLELATEPREFEGLKHLFPFVREGALLGLQRDMGWLACWMAAAFSAGHDLGRAHPELLEEVLPGQELLSHLRRLWVLQQRAEETCLTWAGLQRGCAKIVEIQWAELPAERQEAVFLEAVVKTLRTGFAAGTAAQSDPALCEFVWDVPERIVASMSDIVSRVWIGAPFWSFGLPVARRLEHPLLRLARELYPNHPTERDLVLGYLQNRLRQTGVKSETECPADELELVNWVADGVEYGRAVSAAQPGLVQRVLDEAAGPRLQASLNVVKRVVSEAGGTDPLRLMEPLKKWQKEVYGWNEPGFYGQELARGAYFADFAVWIGWTA